MLKIISMTGEVNFYICWRRLELFICQVNTTVWIQAKDLGTKPAKSDSIKLKRRI